MRSVSGLPRRLARRFRRADLPLIALTLAGVTAVSAIGAVLVVRLRDAGIEHEQREAEEHAELAGRAVVSHFVTDGVLRGDASALAALDRVVRQHVLRHPVTRVKLWAPDGRIVYSDEPRLIGERFDLAADEHEILIAGGVTSALSDLRRPENRFERGEERLLEVYTRIEGASGGPVLFEAYQRFEPITASGKRIWLTVLPALLGGLLLLQLTNFALARWFASHIRRRDRQRAELLARTLDATSTERRRIAADLHDGVVQDLTAASVTLAATAGRLDEHVVGRSTIGALEDASERVRASVGTLRTLLIDFYPADLEQRGLAAAVGDLVALARTRGLTADFDVSPDLHPPVSTAGMLFRVAQEALRNAAAHAQARHVSVSAGDDGVCCWLEVADDGHGFDTEARSPSGHIGLRALRDLLADSGGRLTVRSTPAMGTVVRAELPAR